MCVKQFFAFIVDCKTPTEYIIECVATPVPLLGHRAPEAGDVLEGEVALQAAQVVVAAIGVGPQDPKAQAGPCLHKIAGGKDVVTPCPVDTAVLLAQPAALRLILTGRFGGLAFYLP